MAASLADETQAAVHQNRMLKAKKQAYRMLALRMTSWVTTQLGGSIGVT